MKIMCDTNIILDVLLERQPFVEDSGTPIFQISALSWQLCAFYPIKTG